MQDDKEPQGNPWMKSVMIWSGILLAMLLVASMFGSATQPAGQSLAYSAFRQKVEEGSVKQVVLSADRVTGELTTGDRSTANVVRQPELPTLPNARSETPTSDLQCRMRSAYASFALQTTRH